MTVSEIAKNYHVTPQAIRNKVRRAGYNLDELRRPGSNQISEDGERIINELFAAAPSARKGKNGTGSGGQGKKESTQGNQGSAGPGSTLAIIRAERDELKIRTATAETLAAERQKTIEFLQEQIREKDATIAKLAAAAAIKPALPEPPAPDPDTHSRRGLFAWFHRKGEKK